MSQTKEKRALTEGNGLVGRARGVAVMAVPVGQRAGTVAAQRVQRGMHRARKWSAPRIEGAADVVESTITPAVASTLRRGARKVRPRQESRTRTMTHSMMSWRGLVALLAALGAAGAGAVAIRKRFANPADAEKKVNVDAATSEPGADEADSAAAVPAQGGEQAAQDSRVNSGW